MYEECYDDCHKILEYCSVIENGYLKSKKVCVKALYRKIKSGIHLQKENLLDDIEELKKLDNGKEVKILEEELKFKLKEQKFKNIQNTYYDDNKKQLQHIVDYILSIKNNKSLDQVDIIKLLKSLKIPENLEFFIQKNGLLYVIKLLR